MSQQISGLPAPWRAEHYVGPFTGLPVVWLFRDLAFICAGRPREGEAPRDAALRWIAEEEAKA